MTSAPIPIHPASEPAVEYPADIKNAPFNGWDNKIFAQHLIRSSLAPTVSNLPNDNVRTPSKAGQGTMKNGTWGHTQLALTELYSRIEQAYATYFEARGIDTAIPLDIENRNELYQWSQDTEYPPHLDILPKDQKFAQDQLFSALGLDQATLMVINIVPKNFIEQIAEDELEGVRDVLFGRNYRGKTLEDLRRHNENLSHRRTATDVMQGHNIGDLPDWFSDARFAQQYFTGTNPTTIRTADAYWIERFHRAAVVQGESTKAVADFIAKTDASSFYVQDYSYYREAVGAPADAIISAGTGRETKYCAAPVCLFHLPESGQLHPIAIVIDFKKDLENSVCIFNKRLQPIVPDSPEAPEQLEAEKDDWPWRYAKQVVQMADWCLHEIVVHLTWTHFMEETTIVAANRAFSIHHPVFTLLEPHWYRTLQINLGARKQLVPVIIFGIIGLGGEQPYNFIKYHYKNFDWQERYVPVDLEKRGFPLKDLDNPKFKNYAYGRNMILMWNCIREFVSKMLTERYPKDRDVEDDKEIAIWCEECQTHGQITNFPTIKTRDQLFDAVTMSIHLASPQHTAVNYLQNYYQVFVPSKPPALYTAPPTSLADLQMYVEDDILHSLPVGHQRDWLLAAHIPWLLSFKTAKENSLLEYSISLYNLVVHSSEVTDRQTKKVAAEFYAKLMEIGKVFKRHSDEMTKGTVPYTVMDPASTAVSVLI